MSGFTTSTVVLKLPSPLALAGGYFYNRSEVCAACECTRPLLEPRRRFLPSSPSASPKTCSGPGDPPRHQHHRHH
eukprot:9472312-Pyramimonas_sp.AAC.1